MELLITVCELFLSLPDLVCPPISSGMEPIYFSARDFGEEFDEEELAGELIAALPVEMKVTPLPAVDPDEFESGYQWFVS